MRVLVTVLIIANLIATQCAPIGKSNQLSVDELFEIAWEYQNKLNPRQQDIDNEVTEFRTSLSRVLKVTSKEALEEVEENSKIILELEKPVRSAVSELKEGDCSKNLNNLLTATTEFTGYESSVCVKYYDKSVIAEVREAQDLISAYDGIFTELQQLVVQAFVGRNQFNQQEEIVEAFEVEYDRRIEAWEEIKPDIDNFIDDLTNDVEKSNEELKVCMKAIQDDVLLAYNRMSDRIQTCIDFENTPNPFKSSFTPLLLQDILPNRDLSYL